METQTPEVQTAPEHVLFEKKVSHQGQDFILRPAIYDTMKDYAELICQRAYKVVQAQSEILGPVNTQLQLDRVTDRFATYKYTWGSQNWAEALNTDDGATALLLMLLKQDNPEVKKMPPMAAEKMADEIFKAAAWLDEKEGILRNEISAFLRRMINRPNLPTQAPGLILKTN